MESKTTWESLSIWEKMHLIKIWHVVSMIGNVMMVTGQLSWFSSNHISLKLTEFFVGFGTFFTWFSFTLYLTQHRRYSVIWRTFVNAFPLFVKVLCGVGPFLIGTALLFFTLFWGNTINWQFWYQAQFELFSLQTGDAIQDFYNSTVAVRFFATNCFFLIYIFLAISLMQNIFMVIVEDSYLAVKYSKSTDWLLKEEDKK